tara:strand:- start:86 stop:334 length:249 start_codon:yes stop_codon:yes gene_type:complete
MSDNIDRLKKLSKPMNLEKDVRTIKKILSTPNRVYGHGLVDQKDFEKLIQRVERLELQLRELRIKTGNNDNLDRLQNDKTSK